MPCSSAETQACYMQLFNNVSTICCSYSEKRLVLCTSLTTHITSQKEKGKNSAHFSHIPNLSIFSPFHLANRAPFLTLSLAIKVMISLHIGRLVLFWNNFFLFFFLVTSQDENSKFWSLSRAVNISCMLQV